MVGRTDDASLASPARLRWYAVYTRSRHEKVVDQALAERGVESFLPAVEVLSQWKDRRKRVRKPLFPGYLFARARRVDVPRWRGIRGLVDVVSNAEGPIPVPDGQVSAVRRMIETQARVDPWPYLRTGRRVRVRRGPLAGLEGFIVRRKRAYRLVLSVDLLGRSVATEIDVECAEVV